MGLLQNHLVPKWDSLFRSENGTEGVYIFPDDGSSNIPNTTVPHNQYLAITEAFMLLAQATGNADYEVRAGLLATAFRNSLRPVGTAFEWDYWNPKLSTDGTPSWSPSVEDTSHGGLDVAAAIRGYETGIVFDRADMDCLVSTLLDVMWDQNTTDPNIGDRVNTSAGTLYKYNTGSNWNRLGMFDPLAYSVVRTLFENKWNTSGMTYSDLADIAEIICSDNILQDEFETENSVDPTLPDGWVRWQSSSATAYMDSPAAYEGRFALTVKTNPSGGWQVIEKVFPYQPGTAYTVGFLGRAANTNVGGRAEIRDATTNTVLGYRTFTNTGWASQSFTFVAPVAGHTVKIRLYPAAWNVANGIVHYENVRIHE